MVCRVYLMLTCIACSCYAVRLLPAEGGVVVVVVAAGGAAAAEVTLGLQLIPAEAAADTWRIFFT